MFHVWYDEDLSHFGKPVWRVGNTSIGYTSRAIAEFESLGISRKYNKETCCICGFCKDTSGEYKAHYINSKGTEIIKPVYKTQNGYMVKNGKHNYFLTEIETKWLDTLLGG